MCEAWVASRARGVANPRTSSGMGQSAKNSGTKPGTVPWRGRSERALTLAPANPQAEVPPAAPQAHIGSAAEPQCNRVLPASKHG